MSNTIKSRISLRGDTATNWSNSSVVLLKNELGIESDTRKIKIGDSIHTWNELEYANSTPAEISASISVLTGTINEIVDSNNDTQEKVSSNLTKINTNTDDIAANTAKITTNTDKLDTITTTKMSEWSNKQNKETTLGGYGITDAYTKSQVDGLVSSVFRFMGVKSTFDALPASNNTTGDVWHVNSDGGEYVYNGSTWDELGSIVDLTNYVTELALNTALANKVSVEQGKSLVLDTLITKLEGLPDNATKVEVSETNGNIKVNGNEVSVYELPSDVLTQDTYFIIDCGSSIDNSLESSSSSSNEVAKTIAYRYNIGLLDTVDTAIPMEYVTLDSDVDDRVILYVYDDNTAEIKGSGNIPVELFRNEGKDDYANKLNIPVILTELDITELTGATNFNRMCYDANNIKTIKVVVPESIVILDEFLEESSIENLEITIPEGVTSMRRAFGGSADLTNVDITIPSTVTTLDGCFSNCNNLSGTILIKSTPTSYGSCFSEAGSTNLSETTTVNWTSSCTNIDAILGDVSGAPGNFVKGHLI